MRFNHTKRSFFPDIATKYSSQKAIISVLVLVFTNFTEASAFSKTSNEADTDSYIEKVVLKPYSIQALDSIPYERLINIDMQVDEGDLLYENEEDWDLEVESENGEKAASKELKLDQTSEYSLNSNPTLNKPSNGFISQNSPKVVSATNFKIRAVTPTIKVCYNSDTYGMNGGQKSFQDEKLLNTANFGPSGTVDVIFDLFHLGTANNSISQTSLVSNGCQILYLGGNNANAGRFDINGNPGGIFGIGAQASALTTAEVDAAKAWAASTNNVLITFQGFAAYAGGTTEYAGSNQNSNPNKLSVIGESVISGSFGQTSSFNQGGSWQGSFTSYPATACIITEDNAGRPTGLINSITGDFYFSDFDLLSELGGLTNNANISSNTDKFFANLFASAARVVLDGPSDACAFFSCPAGNSAPPLSASSISGTGVPVDVNPLHTGTAPAQTTLTWHNAQPVSDENYVGNSSNYLQTGTLYASYRANDGSCYSPASPVLVSISSPDLAVTLSPTLATVASGETQSYTVTVTNNGPIAAPDALVKVPISDGRSLVLASPSQGTYSGTTELWSIGALANGATVTMDVTIRVD